MKVRRLDVNGDIMFGAGLSSYAIEQEACKQNVRSRLLLMFAEWFLDTSDGVPYVDTLFAKPVNVPLLEATIKERILETTDVVSIVAFSFSLDNETRKSIIQVAVTTAYDTTESIGVSL